jgi:ribosome biogenesis GTPase A
MKNVVFRPEFKVPSRVLNWFPGHMRKAMRTMELESKKASLFLEVRDARIPRTSRNKEILTVLPPKMKRMILYNKVDLANEKRSLEIINNIHKEGSEKDIPWLHLSTKKNVNVNKLLKFITDNSTV